MSPEQIDGRPRRRTKRHLRARRGALRDGDRAARVCRQHVERGHSPRFSTAIRRRSPRSSRMRRPAFERLVHDVPRKGSGSAMAVRARRRRCSSPRSLAVALPPWRRNNRNRRWTQSLGWAVAAVALIAAAVPYVTRRSERRAAGTPRACRSRRQPTALSQATWKPCDLPCRRMDDNSRSSRPMPGWRGASGCAPLSSVESTPIAGTDGASSVFWSPDSRSIGFVVGTDHEAVGPRHRRGDHDLPGASRASA